MSEQVERLAHALARFDACNVEDPNKIEIDGEMRPAELVYAERMTARLQQFCPNASEQLQLAARAQHIRRWSIPRSQYPMNRKGYHDWRNELKAFHAATAGEILREVGYEHETIAEVQALLAKVDLDDPEMQALEDVICLVFIEHYLQDFAQEQPENKLIRIIRKTWQKMSPAGHAAAAEIGLPKPLAEAVAKAVQGIPA